MEFNENSVRNFIRDEQLYDDTRANIRVIMNHFRFNNLLTKRVRSRFFHFVCPNLYLQLLSPKCYHLSIYVL